MFLTSPYIDQAISLKTPRGRSMMSEMAIFRQSRQTNDVKSLLLEAKNGVEYRL
jgi:hypothetical protein